MPLMRCTGEGKPGWKYGESGKCYTYEPGNKASALRAKKKAIRQGLAITRDRLEGTDAGGEK